MKIAKDRRTATRIAADRPCRLRRASSARFDHARTVNVSTSGALIEVRTPMAPAIGETFALAVAWSNAPIVRADAFVPVRVVRSLPAPDSDARQVAVEFCATESVAMAA